MKKSNQNAIIQVKGNQPKLLCKCSQTAKSEKAIGKYTSNEKSRNRIEKRKVFVFKSLILKKTPWNKYVKAIIKVERNRKEFNTKEKRWIESFEDAYYISTIKLTAKKFHQAIREHWHIENKNHYVKDVSMNEDRSRIRVNPHIMVKLRSFALNILRVNKVENVNCELYKNSLNFNRLYEYKRLFQKN